MLVPRMIATVANAGPVIVPTIATFNGVTIQTPQCGVNWMARFDWTISDPNNVGYKLQLIDTTLGTPFPGAEDLDCADGFFDYTGNTGAFGGTGTFQTVSGQLKVVRRSDDTVVNSSGVENVTEESGPPC